MTRDEKIQGALLQARIQINAGLLDSADKFIALALSALAAPPAREQNAVDRLHNLVDGLSKCDVCEQDACDENGPVTLCGKCWAKHDDRVPATPRERARGGQDVTYDYSKRQPYLKFRPCGGHGVWSVRVKTGIACGRCGAEMHRPNETCRAPACPEPEGDRTCPKCGGSRVGAHYCLDCGAPEAKGGTPFSRIFGAMPEFPNPETGLDDDPAPKAKETTCSESGGADCSIADRAGAASGERCPSSGARAVTGAGSSSDPAPATRCDGSPGEPGWSLTPTGCVRFDNNGQMIRCSGCPSCQGRK